MMTRSIAFGSARRPQFSYGTALRKIARAHARCTLLRMIMGIACNDDDNRALAGREQNDAFKRFTLYRKASPNSRWAVCRAPGEISTVEPCWPLIDLVRLPC